MKEFKNFFNKTEKEFNQMTAKIENVIQSIKNTVSYDYYNNEIETSTLLENLDKDMEDFKDYLTSLKILSNMATTQIFLQEGKGLDTVSDVEMYAQMFVLDMVYKTNAYSDIFNKYEEYAKAVKENATKTGGI